MTIAFCLSRLAGSVCAIAGAALGAGAYYGGYGPGYYGDCFWQRQRFWDGYGWQMRRVRVCN